LAKIVLKDVPAVEKKNNGKDKIKWITDHNLKRSEIVIYRRFFSNSLVLYKFRVSISFLRTAGACEKGKSEEGLRNDNSVEKVEKKR